MKKHAKILILALCCALLLSSAVYAANRTRTLEVTYSDIKLVVDGNAVTPKDATGAVVEPFIYEGTTYLPVRAVGEALGKQVNWDGNSKTVYIGAVPGQATYLMDVCPPYQGQRYNAPEYFEMMGTRYMHGFTAQCGYEGFTLFNLNGEYSTLAFDLGHVDGTSMIDTTFNIYFDGKLYDTITATSDMLVTHMVLPLNHALQLKITWERHSDLPEYGFANMVLS